jgi:sec-independent protein translocase protein TatA
MGGLSIWHLLILLAVVVLVFGGGGKLSKIMGDFGKGINAFKSGIKDEETRKREEEEARIAQARSVGSQTAEGGVRQDDVIRR